MVVRPRVARTVVLMVVLAAAVKVPRMVALRLV
jgi:hypothetical protein